MLPTGSKREVFFLDQTHSFDSLLETLQKRELFDLVAVLRDQCLKKANTPHKNVAKTKQSAFTLPPEHVTHWVHLGRIDDFNTIFEFLAVANKAHSTTQRALLDGRNLVLRSLLFTNRLYWILPDLASLDIFFEEPKTVTQLLTLHQVHLHWIGGAVAIPSELQAQYIASQIAWSIAGGGYSVSADPQLSQIHINKVETFTSSLNRFKRECESFIYEMDSAHSSDANNNSTQCSKVNNNGSGLDQLLACCRRVREHQKSERDERALPCFTEELALTKQQTAAHSFGRGKTLLLCGAGPSLNEVISALAPGLPPHSCGEPVSFGERVVVAAAGSALPLLDAAGIRPNIFFAVDPFNAQETRMRRVGNLGVPVIYRPRWNTRAKSLFSSPKMLAGGSCGYSLIDKTLGLSDPELVDIAEGSNVCCFALNWAKAMGFSRIVLAGIDLVQTTNVPYPILKNPLQKAKKDNQGLLEQWSATAFFEAERARSALCHDGEYRPTSSQWLAEKSFIESFVQENPGIDVQRISQHGLKLDCELTTIEALLATMDHDGDCAQIDSCNLTWSYVCASKQVVAAKDELMIALIAAFRECMGIDLSCRGLSLESVLEDLAHFERGLLDAQIEGTLLKLQSSQFYMEFLRLWDQALMARYHYLEKENSRAMQQLGEISREPPRPHPGLDFQQVRLHYLLCALRGVVKKMLPFR
mgnify:CR=1 FL=1